MFDSSDDEPRGSSPTPSRARSQERDDSNGSRHRDEDDCGTSTSVGTTQQELDHNVLRLAPEIKPLLPPESLINCLSGVTSDHHRIPLFNASKIHGLKCGVKGFNDAEDYYLDVFFQHRWYNGNHKRDKSSLLQAWNALSAM